MSVRLRIKWLWVRITLLSLKLQIWRLLRARSSLTLRQTIECEFTLKLVYDIQSVDFLQCIMVISKIKYNFFLIWIFYYFGLKKSLFHDWRDEKKNTKTLNLFHVFYGCKKSKKSFTAVLTYIKTARFEASSTVLRKWEVSAGLQIYPKKIFRRTRRAMHLKKAHRARR